MQRHARLKSLSALLLVAAVAGLGMAGPATAAASAPALTAQQLTTKLKGSDLTRWNALTSSQRTHVVSVLNDPRLVGDLTDAQAKAISPDLSVTESSGTVPMSGAALLEPATASLAASAAASYEVSSYYEKAWTILGITYTKVRLDYYYVTGSGIVLSDHYCTASYTNYVPLRSATAQVNHYVSGGVGQCTALWTLTKANFWTTSGTQGMTVNGSGVASTWGP